MGPRMRTRRGARSAFATGAAGCVVLGGLMAGQWRVVKQHLAAWDFVLSTETLALEPRHVDPANRILGTTGLFPVERACQHLADQSDFTVVLDARDRRRVQLDANPLTAAAVMEALCENGYRIIEQRFPRAAYVVIHRPLSPGEQPPEPPRRPAAPQVATLRRAAPPR